jgi:hypothetical protein
VIVNVLVFLLIFFWMIPVAFASSIANLTTLTSLLPFLVPILDLSATVKGFIEGFLPGLILIIFFAILVKFIITPLARVENPLSHAQVEGSGEETEKGGRKDLMFFSLFLQCSTNTGFFWCSTSSSGRLLQVEFSTCCPRLLQVTNRNLLSIDELF